MHAQARVLRSCGLRSGVGRVPLRCGEFHGLKNRPSQRSIVFKEVCTCVSIPVWLATMSALWHGLDNGFQRDCLGPALACC